MTIGEKVSYITGLAEGLALDESTKEGKVLNAIIDVLGDIAEAIDEIDADLNEVTDVVIDLEDSVADLEDEVYDLDDEDEDYDDYDEDDDDDLDELYETTCPECKNTFNFDYEQAATGTMDCPNCGAHLEFQLEDEDDAD